MFKSGVLYTGSSVWPDVPKLPLKLTVDPFISVTFPSFRPFKKAVVSLEAFLPSILKCHAPELCCLRMIGPQPATLS